MESNQNIYNPSIKKFLELKLEGLPDRDYDVFDSVLSISDMITFKNRFIKEYRV